MTQQPKEKIINVPDRVFLSTWNKHTNNQFAIRVEKLRALLREIDDGVYDPKRNEAEENV